MGHIDRRHELGCLVEALGDWWDVWTLIIIFVLLTVNNNLIQRKIPFDILTVAFAGDNVGQVVRQPCHLGCLNLALAFLRFVDAMVVVINWRSQSSAIQYDETKHRRRFVGTCLYTTTKSMERGCMSQTQRCVLYVGMPKSPHCISFRWIAISVLIGEPNDDSCKVPSLFGVHQDGISFCAIAGVRRLAFRLRPLTVYQDLL